MNGLLTTTNGFLWSYIIVALLIIVGLYFTFRSRFLQVRMLKEMVIVLKEGTNKQKIWRITVPSLCY